jgi:NADPH:quinone reductase-like Zn-dependent oxidoreductase
MNNPDKMKAITLEQYNPNIVRALRSMKICEMPTPKPGPDQVLVKVEASPVNPSDIAFLLGGYNIVKPLPAIPGFEGVGRIVEAGDSIDSSFVGERVTFFTQDDTGGAWAEYVVLNRDQVIPVSIELPLEQAACLFVNPFTAYALFDHIHENRHKAIIQSASNGQVGRFIRFFAGEHNLEVINLVRKRAHVDLMKQAGCKHVLDIHEDDFEQKIKELSDSLGATAAIDAVGGELTGKLLNNMPEGSEVIVYGGLSGMPVSGIETLELIFKNKILSGFNLNDWLADKSAEEFKKISGYIQLLFMEKKLETSINQTYDFIHFYDALRSYISNMSAGKIILKMS